MSQDLLITLGHNSSVILVEDGQIVNGYEHERITGVKSDSRFPLRTMVELEVSTKYTNNAYITHWHPYADLDSLSEKYWNPDIFDGVMITTHSPTMTHHDTHAWAALAFAGKDFPRNDTAIFVVDGFGSYGEHISVYKMNEQGEPVLLRRRHGYATSLGLMYQYATAYLGMKMHEDEYKLLGYEVHIQEIGLNARQYKVIDDFCNKFIANWFNIDIKIHDPMDPMFSLDALENVKNNLFRQFNAFFTDIGITNSNSYEARVILAFSIQNILEAIVLAMVQATECKNLIVSGGVFYNVKLNKLLLDMVPGKFCAYPLAGDQGNAIGLYYANNRDFVFPDTLCWGKRRLYNPGQVKGLTFVNSLDAVDVITRAIDECGYVNIVRGAMEFGPRALCHTSTLALPTLEIVERINKANNRNTVMPMAPVVTREFWQKNFKHCDKIWRSEAYMVIAQEYNEDSDVTSFEGAAHKYSLPHEHYTGRPQVATDKFMNDILANFGGILINTSFNFHGKPIAYDTSSIIENHRLQHARDNSFYTIVIQD